MDWFLARMKAWVAIAAPLVTGAIIKATEQATGFDVPTDIELMIVAAVTGLFVHQVPNKKVAG